MKDKKQTTVSIDAEKAFDKIQHPLMIKNSHQSGYLGTVPQRNKGHMTNSQLTLYSMVTS